MLGIGGAKHLALEQLAGEGGGGGGGEAHAHDQTPSLSTRGCALCAEVCPDQGYCEF